MLPSGFVAKRRGAFHIASNLSSYICYTLVTLCSRLEERHGEGKSVADVRREYAGLRQDVEALLL